MSHFLELVIEGGEPRIKFCCNGTADASCRRRPPDWRDRESWTAEEATQGGFACWAVEWIENVGIEDAIFGDDRVLSSVEVDIYYDEGVTVYPIQQHTQLDIEGLRRLADELDVIGGSVSEFVSSETINQAADMLRSFAGEVTA